MKYKSFLVGIALLVLFNSSANATRHDPRNEQLSSLRGEISSYNIPQRKPPSRSGRVKINKYIKKNSTKKVASKKSYSKKVSVSARFSAGPKPKRWCGWWMRTIKGGGPEYNLARNWAKRGTNAGGPKIGAVVVWKGHVGLITGKSSNGQWIVKSGNDSNQVRERPRSLKHRTGYPIAFRMV